jgi:hypothetical protein
LIYPIKVCCTTSESARAIWLDDMQQLDPFLVVSSYLKYRICLCAELSRSICAERQVRSRGSRGRYPGFSLFIHTLLILYHSSLGRMTAHGVS